MLTSRLVGLYNCYDALKNHRKSHIREDNHAPLFETGIVCTEKKVFYGIVAVRILSWVLIFSTNLFIRGRSEKIIETRTASITTLGRFSVFDPIEQRQEHLFLRKSCVGRTENSSFYGEIRDGNCQIDRKLFWGSTVEFGFNFERTFVSINRCRAKNESMARLQYFRCNNTAAPTTTTTGLIITCTYNKTDGVISDDLCFQKGTDPFVPCVRTVQKEQKKNVPFDCGTGGNAQKLTCNQIAGSRRKFSICDNAVIGCRIRPKGLICAGFVSINATTYICKNLKMGPQQNPNAKCKVAKGAVWNITDWIPFYGIDELDSISNAFAVAYGSGSETRLVKQYKGKDKRSVTAVHKLWTGVLATKIIMVVALYVVCEFLTRRYGVFLVANDEPRILSLLNTTVTRIRCGRTARFVSSNIKLRVALDNGVVRLHDTEEGT